MSRSTSVLEITQNICQACGMDSVSG